MREGVFLTGGTGFVGRHLLPLLLPHSRVRRLTRRPMGNPSSAVGEVIVGELQQPATYASALSETAIVVHLAAVTGKAPEAEYFAVNVEGTRALLDACRRAGVPRFVFVSSIAATYRNTLSYHYARSKQLAEQAVRESGLDYLIVRPTLILGQGSPISEKLATLARLPVMPIFGDGSVRVQPIDVRDVSTFLAATVADPTFRNGALDLGGPEVESFERFLRRIRRALVGRESPVIHLPAESVMKILDWIERWTARLPLTAGQLSVFVNDSVAAYDPLVHIRVPRMKSIDDMVQALTAHG